MPPKPEDLFIEFPTPQQTLEVKSPGATADEMKKQKKHVLRVRNSAGEITHRVIFRGFTDNTLDAAIDAFILAHTLGNAEDSFLWEQLYRQELERGDQH